ncbi:hypothetical protein FG386_003142 [Cryptosporidium ryanae]|uniref:uncharacterized protein n=1 Tax=Cryptosporidium ryanae TaxID=515981 RepID=UPI00351A5B39|nr:hypothetical protein FG386_003142 [Cryptosporidium ryanae]
MSRLLLAINSLLICVKIVNGSHNDYIGNSNIKISRNNDISNGNKELNIIELFADDHATFSDESVFELQDDESLKTNPVHRKNFEEEFIDIKDKSGKFLTKIKDYIDSEYSENEITERNKKVQKPFSIKQILSDYNSDETKLINEFYLAFTLLIRRGLKKYFFKKYKPSNIRSMFAKKYAQLFGCSTTSALLKLRDFERKLSLKHSAARKLFLSQFKLLEFTLNSYKANIHLARKWRNQPTYVSEPILVVNKASYNKISSLCKKGNIDIILITASPENIPKKFGKPDLNESYLGLPKLSNLIQSIQNSLSGNDDEVFPTFGTTECKWRSSKKKTKTIISKLFCFHRKKKQFVHIHFYDVKNVNIFTKLIKGILKYRPTIDTLEARPLFLIPALLGIPEINQKGTIIGLNSINIRKNPKKYRTNKNKRKKRR